MADTIPCFIVNTLLIALKFRDILSRYLAILGAF